MKQVFSLKQTLSFIISFFFICLIIIGIRYYSYNQEMIIRQEIKNETHINNIFSKIGMSLLELMEKEEKDELSFNDLKESLIEINKDLSKNTDKHFEKKIEKTRSINIYLIKNGDKIDKQGRLLLLKESYDNYTKASINTLKNNFTKKMEFLK